MKHNRGRGCRGGGQGGGLMLAFAAGFLLCLCFDSKLPVILAAAILAVIILTRLRD